jgi:hypothetical protein
MKLKVDMTLNAETAERFQEVATRLVGLGDDGIFAATVLLRIVESYERAAVEASRTLPVENLNAENDE